MKKQAKLAGTMVACLAGMNHTPNHTKSSQSHEGHPACVCTDGREAERDVTQGCRLATTERED